MEAILHGLILALGLILPLGVQNVFVFTQGAVQPRFARALPAVIAESLCDTLLISLAVFGVSAVVMQIEALRFGLMLAGIIFLAYMGTTLWRSRPDAGTSASAQALPASRQILFAFSVSLLNPHALLDTVGVIGTSALAYEGTAQLRFAAACILVSWLWFIGLAALGSTLRRLGDGGRWMTVFNRSSALFIWGTALYLLWNLIRSSGFL